MIPSLLGADSIGQGPCSSVFTEPSEQGQHLPDLAQTTCLFVLG